MSAHAPFVRVHGRGLAAMAALLALTRLGLPAAWACAPQSGRPGPPLVLNDVCLSLLRELGVELRGRGLALHERVVRWGGAPPVRVAEAGLAIASADLLEAVEAALPPLSSAQAPAPWELLAGGPDPQRKDSVVLRAGQRRVQLHRVRLHGLEPGRYLVESTAEGWLMLQPTGSEEGVLQLMSPPSRNEAALLDQTLRRSTLVAPKLQLLEPLGSFAAAPYLRWPAAGPACLRVGSGCAGLDPISGEGSPFALRSALLAAAVIGDIVAGRVEAEAALQHYRDRLALTWLAHVEGCERFYAEGMSWRHMGWREELRQMAAARAELEQLAQPPAPAQLRFEFAGDHLAPRARDHAGS